MVVAMATVSARVGEHYAIRRLGVRQERCAVKSPGGPPDTSRDCVGTCSDATTVPEWGLESGASGC